MIRNHVTGHWSPEHTDKGHFYKHRDTGTKVISVTGILTLLSKPHLIPWSCKVALEYFIAHLLDWNEWSEPENREAIFKSAQFAHTGVRDDAGNVGTLAHDKIEEYLKDWITHGTPISTIRTIVPPDSDPRVFAAVRSAERIMQERNLIPIASEILVGSTKVRSAGTLDALVMDSDGKLILADWKTSNQVDPIGYTLQVAAYAKFFEEMTSLKIHKVQIFHLSKDYAKCDVWDVPRPARAYQMFKHLVKIHEWMNDPKSKAYKKVNKIII